MLSFEGARLSSLGDAAVVITLGDEIGVEAHEQVKAVTQMLESTPPDAIVEYIPAFTTVTVIYDPLAATCEDFTHQLRALLDSTPRSSAAIANRLVEIPVCYGEDFGPDLDFVASHNDITSDQVVAIHGEPEYLVYMIGFAPGFPYLGGMSERIAAPRRGTPREKIPAGSVGIAGNQTGVYPIQTPGGWQLIGRTPLELFRPTEGEPSLLRAGDRVRFKAIERDEYDELLERTEAS